MKIIYIILLGFLFSCAHTDTDFHDVPDRPYTEVKKNDTYNYSIFNNANQLKNKSGYWPLMDHIDSLGARLYLTTIAKKSITVQYYSYHNDGVGKLINYALLHAADRGVKVEILLDDMQFTSDTKWPLIMEYHPNITLRSFNPTKSRDNSHYVEIGLYSDTLGRRMHNKSFIVDNSIAVIGGRNIGEEYFGLNKDTFWIDNDVLVAGRVVSDLTNQFSTYFSSGLSVRFKELYVKKAKGYEKLKQDYYDLFNKPELKELSKSFLNRSFIKNAKKGSLNLYISRSKVFFDDPKKIRTDIEDKSYHLNTQLEGRAKIKKSLHIISPYFLPSEGMMKRTQELIKQGVSVSIITNSLESTDAKSVYAYYSDYQRRLLELGVKLYEVHPHALKEEFKNQDYNKHKVMPKVALHTKTSIIDGRYTMIGSANLDPRSRNLNTEIVSFIDNKALAAKEIEYFNYVAKPENSYSLSINEDDDIEWTAKIDNETLATTTHGDSSIFEKFQMYILRLLPIRDLL